MTKKELKTLLLRETGSENIPEGYNFAIMSLRTKSPIAHGEQILSNLNRIIDRYREKAKHFPRTDAQRDFDNSFKMLPYVLRRTGSVIIPVPYEISLNLFSDSVREILIGEFSSPSWN